MGFLHKLWDETLAGPAPESGLGKLRKYNSFSGRRDPVRLPTPVIADDQIPVSRSITILRGNSASLRNISCTASPDSGSVPSSPAASSTSTSPFQPSTPRTPRGNGKKSMAKGASPPTNGYDWIILSALDR